MQTVEIEEISGRNFEDATVPLDGTQFTDCTFTRCVLTYSGGLPFLLIRCRTDEQTGFKMEGPAAATMDALWTAYHHGRADWVDKLVERIKLPPAHH